MKKAMLMILIFGLGWNTGLSQTINHVKGLKTIGIKYGGTKYSPFRYVTGEFSYFLYNKLMFRTGLNFDSGLIGRTEYNDLNIFVSGAYSLYDIKDKYYLNILGGIRGGIEWTYNIPYSINESYWFYGPFAGIEFEAYFGDFGVSAEFQEYSTIGSPFGNWHWSTTLGLKYIIF